MRIKRLGVLSGLAVVLSFGAPAHAADALPRPGALQLSLDGTLFSYDSTKLTLSSSPDSLSVTQSTTSFGFLGQGLGVGVGVVTRDLVLGLRTELTSSSVSSVNSTLKATELNLLPRLEVMLDGKAVRPFVAAMLGVGYVSADTTASVDQDDVSRTTFLYGGSMGLHAFLSDTLSIDPMLTVLGFSGSETEKITQAGGQGSQDISVSGARILLTLGLSGWIAGEAPPPAPAFTPAPEPPPAPALEDETPVSAEARLPNHRRIFLQVNRDPRLPWVTARVSEPEADSELIACNEVGVLDTTGPVRLRVRARRDEGVRHFLLGALPLRALELLATTEAPLTVCAASWPLDNESRAVIQGFLAQRRALIGESEPASASPPSAPAPIAPDASSALTPAAPATPPTPPTVPSNSFPPAPSTPAPASSAAPAVH